jgi:hypothetical protein
MFEAVAREIVAASAVKCLFLSMERYVGTQNLTPGGLLRAESYVLPRADRRAGPHSEASRLGSLRLIWEAKRRLREFLADIRPSVLVLGNDFGTLEQSLLRVTRSLGVRSLVVQDGVIGPAQPKALRGRHGSGGPLFALKWLLKVFLQRALLGISSSRFGHGGTDLVAVTGQYVKDFLIAQGRRAEEVLVVGQPRFDALERRTSRVARPACARQLNLPEDRKVVLFITQAFSTYGYLSEEEEEATVEKILDGLVALGPDVCRVLKLHPQERPDRYAPLLTRRGWNDKVIVTKDVDLPSLLRCSDLVVTVNSTVALEAVILGIPIITVNLSAEGDYFPYAEEGVARGVYDEKDILPNAHALLYNSEAINAVLSHRERFLQRHACGADGHAGRRTAQLILSMLTAGR